MSSIRIRRPSPAMVVATIALFVALGGGSYAALKIGTKNLKDGSVTSAKIRNGTIGSPDIGRRARAELRGAKGDKGDPGRNGAPGTALAFALVHPNGTVDAARSKGVSSASVSHPRTGVYCFYLGFTARSVSAVVEAGGASNPLNPSGETDDDSIVSARARPDGPRSIGPFGLPENCPGREDASVVVEDPSSSGGANATYTSDRVDETFYVVFN